ncbi:hypothetical protein [Jeotgalibacillus sp. R-1-5s-1]|uniref:hypothetical protein n=1 Tax=Jeotgalibacillus sp. R-1-5s-1 TaxID=2555897 RepID=UPI00106D05A1|nr:hypothetical protein [Jeotgalibacillus sp. R-1-5s-1]TFE03680.1 hypothetical protein E2491_02520 [Jeotgalibacillus sp. R-1-5s-1]
MKKLHLLIFALILTLILAACGTETAEPASEDGTNGTSETIDNEETTEEEAVEEEPVEEEEPAEETEDEAAVGEGEEPAEETAEEETAAGEENGMRLLEQQMTVELEGESTDKTAFLQENTNNGYSMYVLDGFTYTPEEPNVDQVFYNEDPSQYMRVETFPANETDTSFVQEQMAGQRDAVNAENAADWMPENSQFEEVIAGYSTQTEDTDYQSLLAKQGDKLIKITMYTKADTGTQDAFLKMAETIQ